MGRMLFVSVTSVRMLKEPVWCTSCLPLGLGKCVNLLASRQDRISSTESLSDVDTSVVRVNMRLADSNGNYHVATSL